MARCFSFSCPLANELDPEDPDDVETMKIHTGDTEFSDSTWMCLDVDLVKKEDT